MPLISKDEPMKTSVVVVGSHILRHLEAKDTGRATLSEVAVVLKKRGIIRHRTITFALCFLHMAGTIDFREPYLQLIDDKK